MARKYISLQEATKYCNYSQEYLSLRARQGKLKAIKFGRNWVIKKEWLNEYLLGIKEYNDSFAKEKKTIAPPKNLPTEEWLKKDIIGLDEWAGSDFGFDFRKLRKALKPELYMRFGFVVIFILSLIVTNLIFDQKSFKSVYQDVSTFVSSVDRGIDKVLVNMSKGAEEVVEGINNNIERKAIEIVGISKWVLGNISDGTANLKGFVSEMSEIYNLADKFLDKKVVDLGKETYDALPKSAQAVASFVSKARDDYIAADNFVDDKVFSFRRTILNGLWSRLKKLESR